MADYDAYWKPWWDHLNEDERLELNRLSVQLEQLLYDLETCRWHIRQLRNRAYSREHRRSRPKALDHSLESS